MLNRVVLIGRTTKEITLQYTTSNIAFVKFTLAVNRQYSSPNGEKETDFIQCMVWRKQAENMAKYVNKGNLIGVEGRIECGSYDNKDGVRVYTTEIMCDSVQFLESKQQDFTSDTAKEIHDTIHKGEPLEIIEDTLPF